MTEQLVDARWLEPPEPMELTLAALNSLEPGERIRLLIHRIPHLLFPILQEWGYDYQMHDGDDGTYEIFIWQKDDAAAISNRASA